MSYRHDTPSGQWFKEDMERCAACYLNLGHDLADHINSIAEHEVSQAMRQAIWIIRGDRQLVEKFNRRKAAWLEAHRSEFVLVPTFRY